MNLRRHPRHLSTSVALTLTSVLLALWLPAAWAELATRDQAQDALEKLAHARFGVITTAEQKMLRGAPRRQLTWLGPDSDSGNPRNDPIHGDRWGAERTIRADLLRWLITDRDALRYVHPSGISIAAARVDSMVDLSYLKVSRPVTLLSCYLPDGIDISNAQLQGLELRNSRTGPISGDLVRVESDLEFTYGTYGAVSLFRAQVGGDLNFSGSRISEPGGDGLDAVEMTLGGEAEFDDGFTTDGIVDFRLAQIARSLSVRGASFTGNSENGLNVERATIGGTLLWTGITRTARTELDLENARAASLWDDEA